MSGCLPDNIHQWQLLFFLHSWIISSSHTFSLTGGLFLAWSFAVFLFEQSRLHGNNALRPGATSWAASYSTGFIQVMYIWHGEHVCCVNMDLRFILQVVRVIEIKLGPQLKELINALSGRLFISCHTPSNQFGPSWWKTKFCWIHSSLYPIWTCNQNNTKFSNHAKWWSRDMW